MWLVRVHIVSDMEGVCGVTRWEQTAGGAPMYEEARRLYTEEINAAVRGTLAAGATEVVVMDHHEIRAEFIQTGAFDEYRRRPGLAEAGDRALVSRADDFWTAWRQFYL
jgi:D-aminopeptidase